MLPTPLRNLRPTWTHLACAAMITGLMATTAVVPTARAESEAPPAPAAELFAPNLTDFTLDNGLEVVVIPDHRAPVVTHMIWYKAGSADEPEGQSGVAHFLEHLMFKGTKDHPDGEFSKTVAELGGQENAFTTSDYTGYFQRVAKEHLPLMMELEADRMENLVLTDEVVKPEQQVVLEERRMRVDSEPSSRLREALTAMLYVNHPYGSPVIGWQSEIEALNKDSAIAFYDRFYTPNNAVVVIAGDVEPEDVKALAEKTYGKVERRAEPGARMRPQEPTLPGERRISMSDPRVTQESISMNYIVPSDGTGEALEPEALELLSYILGDGPTSRLHKSAVLDKKIAIGAGAYYQSGSLDDGRFGLYASPAPGHDLAEMETLLKSELQSILDNGVTEEELAKAKQSLVAQAIFAQDSQQSLARIFGAALTTGQTVKDVQTWPQRISEVDAGMLQDVARKYLSGLAVTGLLTKPEAPTATSEDKQG